MKKLLLTIVIVITFSFSVSAQFGRSDTFFGEWNENDERLNIGNNEVFNLPDLHGMTYDNTSGAPLGSGLLILGALGAGYAVVRQRMK